MPGILLDTNVVSEAARPAPSPIVIAWLERQVPDALFLSVISIGELTRGIHRLPESRRRASLEVWIAGALASQFDGRILDFDQAAAATWGRLLADSDRAGRTRPLADAQIAAIALCNDLALATRNLRDFEGLGLRLIDPWRA